MADAPPVPVRRVLVAPDRLLHEFVFRERQEPTLGRPERVDDAYLLPFRFDSLDGVVDLVEADVCEFEIGSVFIVHLPDHVDNFPLDCGP